MSWHKTSPSKSTTGRIVALQRVTGLLSRWAPPLASRLAERLFLTPIRYRRPEREAEWSAGARSRTIHTPGGGQLETWTWGDGPRTALLVHGWAGRGLQLGAFVAPLVAAGYRVVTFDGPGHGRSSGRITNLLEFAAAVGHVAREVGGVDTLIAHSFGSVASLVAMARGWIRPAKLVLVASPSTFEMILGQFAEMSGFSSAVIDQMRLRLSRRFGFEWADLEPLRLASGILCPALVVHDRRDESIPFAEGVALAGALPRARLFATDGLGHHRVLRDTTVLDEVAEFALDAEGVGEPGPAFDTEGVRVVMAATNDSRPSPSSTTFDLFDLRLDEREIAGQLAFGRD